MMTAVLPRFELDPSLTAPMMTMPHLFTVVQSGAIVTLSFLWSNQGEDGEVMYATYKGKEPELLGNVTGPHGPFYHTYWTADFRITSPCVIRDTRGHFWVCTQ